MQQGLVKLADPLPGDPAAAPRGTRTREEETRVLEGLVQEREQRLYHSGQEKGSSSDVHGPHRGPATQAYR